MIRSAICLSILLNIAFCNISCNPHRKTIRDCLGKGHIPSYDYSLWARDTTFALHEQIPLKTKKLSVPDSLFGPEVSGLIRCYIILDRNAQISGAVLINSHLQDNKKVVFSYDRDCPIKKYEKKYFQDKKRLESFLIQHAQTLVFSQKGDKVHDENFVFFLAEIVASVDIGKEGQ